MGIEMVQNYGTPMGNNMINTILFTGRLLELWGSKGIPIVRKWRSTIKAELCRDSKAKDGWVRQRLIDLYGTCRNKEGAGTALRSRGPRLASHGLRGLFLERTLHPEAILMSYMEASSQRKLHVSCHSKGRRCKVKRCTKAAGMNNSMCPRHKHQWYRDNHPLKYAFDNLRNRARQRGHEFKLSNERYEELALESGWLNEKRGRRSDSLSINRIKSHIGYTDTNVEIIPYGENSRLAHVHFPAKVALSESDKADTEDDPQLPLAQPWDPNQPF
jgi:hypothetical protein